MLHSFTKLIKGWALFLLPITLLGCIAKEPAKFQSLPQPEPLHTHIAEAPTILPEEPVINSAQSDVTQKKTPKNFDEILLSWKVPDVPVDKFVIYFGFNKEKLDRKIEIPASTLKPAEDPQYGSIYQYYLIDIPTDRNIYVSIMAIRGKDASKMGDIIELKAQA